MAEQNPIRYQDLISPDDSIEKLIGQLEELQKSYKNMADIVKKSAQELADSLQKVSGATEEGKTAGRNYAMDVAQSLSNDKTYLVWVAGMEYATYVEANGYDVITGSGNWLESNIVKERDKFKRYLLSNR